MREPEVLYVTSAPTIDASILSWVAQDGEVLCALTPSDESHEHRWVMSAEDVAHMLDRTLRTRISATFEHATARKALIAALDDFMAMTDPQRLPLGDAR